MSDSVPAHCPGTDSSEAGKASACAGCPNQKICASKPSGPDPDIALIAERLAGVKHKILVLSGKGGVGKSTVSCQLAWAFSEDKNTQVGLMDADICGPSLPKMMGVEGSSVHQTSVGWTPVYVEDNLSVLSVGFMLPNTDDAIIWRGPKKNGLIKQFLRDVDWGDLDFLIIDTPPGTSDEHLSLCSYLKQARVDGAVIVTTPQEVALLDVRKELTFCKKVGVKVLGVIENMSGFVCPKCSKCSTIFKPSTGGAQKLAEDFQVPFLGKIPLDPQLARSCDEGRLLSDSNSPTMAAVAEVVKRIKEAFPQPAEE
mmetsp:Transcript_13913/g.35536  ORF Transcript_13913/g.35536 Transcript_13913/m.35536 type:complete len:312 (-) Transcript_13913:160-1095(-)|eukprot:CAMPEP_0177631410 /NCGR_PEP_ID=MMETSP0447-20121125/1736_1 /TAXON_ID=0 /ORGANISM="Stygamoeba regulata, Strain BSH-02190019" /LENGTH=311 /DNA_ID=CAMNT_0019132895 /DNA_START=142 /DNA_END=1077 /DNA_ORIENTATION=-